MSPALSRRFDHPLRPLRSRMGLGAALLLGCILLLAGCAGSAGLNQRPNVPDQSVLDPATQALDEAMQANAEEFAPRAIDSARRRITLARDILFAAARERRDLRAGERKRVDVLVEQAQLDAREALIETQAKAVNKQLDSLKSESQGAASPDDSQLGFGGQRGASARTGLSNSAPLGN